MQSLRLRLYDPNKPKRAKTVFMFYCEQHRPALLEKKKGQKVNIGNIAKALGKFEKAKDGDKEMEYIGHR